MNVQIPIHVVGGAIDRNADANDALVWLATVLTKFAGAEQAIGRLTLALGLPLKNGSLDRLEQVRNFLKCATDKKCGLLEKRISRWLENRGVRHLLAHATITTLYESDGRMVVITRHLPRDIGDVTPDRMWTIDERQELLRRVSSDCRSIEDHIRNILANPALMARMRKAVS